MPSESHQPLIARCSERTGLTVREIIALAANAPKRYKCYPIAKRSGSGNRIICQPSRELKILQYVFLNEILYGLPVHAAATAYKRHSSIRKNAEIHARSRVILKLDFEAFFPSIKVSDWRRYINQRLPLWTVQDALFSAYVMFWGEGGYEPRCLSIGAPTSPLVSNLLMFDFDTHLSRYAANNGLSYTRYADDITLSSAEYIDKSAAIAAVGDAVEAGVIAGLKLNPAKTRLASKATRRTVTGLVLSNSGNVSLGRDRKRLIRSMVHHALQQGISTEEAEKLAGLLSFARHIEPIFFEALSKKYGSAEMTRLASPPTGLLIAPR